MDFKQLQQVLDPVVDAMKAFVGRSVQPLQTRMTTVTARQDLLEGRVAEIGSKSQQAMNYRGVYKAGTQNEHSDVATWDGSAWHCERDTKSEPGNGLDWKLMVKRGASKAGERGPPGPKGDTPDHRWEGTALAFERPDGGFGIAVDLKGEPGDSGGRTKMGLPIGIGGGSSTTTTGSSWFPAGWN